MTEASTITHKKAKADLIGDVVTFLACRSQPVRTSALIADLADAMDCQPDDIAMDTYLALTALIQCGAVELYSVIWGIRTSGGDGPIEFGGDTEVAAHGRIRGFVRYSPRCEGPTE